MAIGLFFAFWSWVGFETTAVYGEESRNPKKIIPRATLIAVIGLGLFYTFISAMVLAGNGAKTVGRDVDQCTTARHLFFGQVERPRWLPVDVYKILLVIGSFACALAFHNAASRYLYALGREVPAATHKRSARRTRSTALRTSPRPLQSGITLLFTSAFYVFTVASARASRHQGAYSTTTVCWR